MSKEDELNVIVLALLIDTDDPVNFFAFDIKIK